MPPIPTLLALLALSGPQPLLLRRIAAADIPISLQEFMAAHGGEGASFDRTIHSIEARTREREGDNDQLIFYILQSRGHSTDTQVEANFSVYQALGVMHSQQPRPRVHRALVVGPGLDLAPRTGMVDAVEPQCLQPFALADALLALGLSDTTSLEITVDEHVRWFQVPMQNATLVGILNRRDDGSYIAHRAPGRHRAVAHHFRQTAPGYIVHGEEDVGMRGKKVSAFIPRSLGRHEQMGRTNCSSGMTSTG